MAKYVCDYVKVSEIGGKFIETGESINSELKKYEPNMENALISWHAPSKSQFIEHIHGKVHTNLDNVSSGLIKLGEYMQDCADKIYRLDSDLSLLDV